MSARDELQQWIEDADRITGKVSDRWAACWPVAGALSGAILM